MCPEGSVLGTSLRTQFAKLTYRWSFVTEPRFELGLGAGVQYIDTSGSTEVATLGLSAPQAGQVPLPVFGIHTAYALTPKLRVSAGFDIQGATIGSWSGQFGDMRLALDHDTVRHLGFGVACGQLFLDALRSQEPLKNGYTFDYTA